MVEKTLNRKKILDKLKLSDNMMSHRPMVRIVDAVLSEMGECDDCKWNNSSKEIRSCSLIGYTRFSDFGCNRFERKNDDL